MYGSLLLLALLETSKMNSLGLLWVFMDLIPIVRECIYGMDWLVCLVGGTCCDALEETPMLLVCLAKDSSMVELSDFTFN